MDPQKEHAEGAIRVAGGKPTLGVEGGLRKTKDGGGRELQAAGIFRQHVDSERVRRWRGNSKG